MKKISRILIVTTVIFMLGGCFNEKVETDAMTFKNEYEEYNGKTTNSGKKYLNMNIDSVNSIKYSSLKEVNKILDDGTAVIYFGFPKCPWCRNVVPVLLDAASTTSLEEIYYVNMSNLRDTMELDENGNIMTKKEASEDYYTLVSKLADILPDYIIKDDKGKEYATGSKRLYVPLVLFVREGKVEGYHSDTVASQIDPYVALTNDEYKELYNIYLSNIHKVLNDICTDEGC